MSTLEQKQEKEQDEKRIVAPFYRRRTSDGQYIPLRFAYIRVIDVFTEPDDLRTCKVKICLPGSAFEYSTWIKNVKHSRKVYALVDKDTACCTSGSSQYFYYLDDIYVVDGLDQPIYVKSNKKYYVEVFRLPPLVSP